MARNRAAAIDRAAPPPPPQPPQSMPPPPLPPHAIPAANRHHLPGFLQPPPQDDPARADRTRSYRGYVRVVSADWKAAEACRRGKKVCPDYMSNTKTCAVGRKCPLYHHEMPPLPARGGKSAV